MKKALVSMVALAIIVLRSSSSGAQTDFTLLHSFTATVNDGENPYGSLISDGSTLYGMTRCGGVSNEGVVFSIRTGGTDFTLLHSFTATVDDGENPWGSLISDGSTLYGMTRYGGASDEGVIFSIRTGGTDFTLLHSFTGALNDGENPHCSLILDGSTLYGMTYSGGASDGGVVFSIQTGGTDFTLLHSFTASVNDGGYPFGSLILDGSTLFGMTLGGGAADDGVVFSIRTGGTDFTLLHSFTGALNDGDDPQGSLILDGSTLFGMTLSGGAANTNNGVVFSIQTGGTDFTLLHSFTGTVNDGEWPWGSLILDGSTLYGMTSYSGATNNGVVFSLGPELPYPTPSVTNTPTPTPNVTPTPTATLTPPPTTPTVMPTPSPTPTCGPTVLPERLVIESGDYDGDGTSDFVIFREISGLWAVRGVTRVYFGSASDIPAPGDYDGDGTTDIGVFREDSGLWAIRGVTRAHFGSSGDRAVPGDYDGDGCCDVGIFRKGSGLWALRGKTRTYFGSSNDRPVPGDFDGDATKDIGIFRGSSGLWALRNISRVYFGSSGDEAVPGDYDGDVTWEVGIFRPSSGVWAIRGITRSYFGSASDQPVPADFDGDWIDNVGIFRDTSGLWAVWGVTRIYFGASGDIPVSQ